MLDVLYFLNKENKDLNIIEIPYKYGSGLYYIYPPKTCINSLIGISNKLLFEGENILISNILNVKDTNFKIFNCKPPRFFENEIYLDETSIFVNKTDAIIKRNSILDNEIDKHLEHIKKIQKNKNKY